MANYVDNKKFYSLLIEYRKTNNKKIFEEIGRDFLLISQNLLNRSCFIKYTQDRKDEMISDAVFYMCKYINKYNLSRDNPFAYFTMIAQHAFLQNINKYNKIDSVFTNIEYIENMENNQFLW